MSIRVLINTGSTLIQAANNEEGVVGQRTWIAITSRFFARCNSTGTRRGLGRRKWNGQAGQGSLAMEGYGFFYLSSSGSSARSSLCSQQAGVSGFWCHRLERLAFPCRICAVSRGFRTTTQDLSVFSVHTKTLSYGMLTLLPFVTTVWTPVSMQ